METINLKKMQRKSRSRHATSSLNSNERKVAYYIRCSTEEQAENPDGTIKNQEDRLSLALKVRQDSGGFSGKFTGAYCDAGRSGKDMNRPELKRLLTDIERGEITLVMVTELSRLSRSIKDFSEIWEFMQSHGCAFLSLRENFDTSNAAGEMMLYSLANFAQFERRQTSERVAANFEARAKRGLWNGGVLPLGYEPDPDQRGSLRIVEDEAKTVRAAFQALLTYGSVSQAAKYLNANGYRYGMPMRGGGGVRLDHFIFDNLYRLLSNPAYAGIRRFKTKTGWQEGDAIWKPIIDGKIFAEAQKMLLAGRKQKTGRESRYPYLLSTRLYCEECGSILVGKSAHGRNGKVGYYAHGAQEKREHALPIKSEKCTPFRVPAKKIEDRVWKEVLQIIEGTHRQKLMDAIQSLEKGENSDGKFRQKENESNALRLKIGTLAHRVANLPKEIPADAFYAEMKMLSEQSKKLDSEIEELKRAGTSKETVTEEQFDRLLRKLKTLLPDVSEATSEIKRRIIQILVHKVVVNKSGFEMHFYAGATQIKKGEALASPLESLSKNFFVVGSIKNLNGGLGRNRTADTRLFRALLYRLSYQPTVALNKREI
jgi:site-specific DNA recombinase